MLLKLLGMKPSFYEINIIDLTLQWLSDIIEICTQIHSLEVEYKDYLYKKNRVNIQMTINLVHKRLKKIPISFLKKRRKKRVKLTWFKKR